MNMNLSELINEILSEWAYRCDDGMPNPKNKVHLNELSIVLSEMGLSHIKDTLVENLLTEKGKTPEGIEEADKNFSNPILNKKVTYRNDKGEDKEGIVGNLLRQPEGSPARDAAEKMLPPEGSPERETLNQELGGEGQPKKPEDGKGKDGEAGGAPKEDPIKKAAPMFDPKVDPAMGARMDREKEANAKLAQKAQDDFKAQSDKAQADFKAQSDKAQADFKAQSGDKVEKAKAKGYDFYKLSLDDTELKAEEDKERNAVADARERGDEKGVAANTLKYTQTRIARAKKEGDKEAEQMWSDDYASKRKDYESKYGKPEDEFDLSKEEPNPLDSKFNPIDTKDVAKEMPQADPETFNGDSDIPDKIDPKQLEKFNTDINKVAQQVADAKAKGEPAPNVNLCDVTVPGTNLYCDDNLGIPRDEMPQFKGNASPGSRAAGMDKDASGEVDTEPVFKEMLKQKGIKTLQTEVPADKLKATQKDLVGAKVVGMMGALEKDPNHPKITAPIYVSRDGYVIDGHHRWAAVVAYNAQNPDKQIQMKTTVLDQDIKDAIPMANKFAEDMGIAAKKADANKETPSTPTSAPKLTDKIKQKIDNWTKEEKAFFEKNEGAPGSETRRSLGQALKDKAAGAWKAIKKGAKHEVEEFKAAGEGVGKFFKGEKLSEHETKALKAVAFKVATTAVFGAAFGGLSHGVAAFGKHVAIEFIPHVVGETILKGASKAALFADMEGEAETDANMAKFAEMIAKGLEEMEISDEMMEQMVDSYNKKKENGETDNVETPIEPKMKEENLNLSNELMLEMIYGFIDEAKGDTFTAIKKDTGMTSVFKSKEARDSAVKGGTHKMPKGSKEAPKKAPTKNMFTGDAEYQKRLGKEKPTKVAKPTKVEPTPTATKPAKGARIIGGKDKTLAKVDTLKSKEFTQKQQPDGVKFAEKNKAHTIPPPYKLPKELFQNSKVPSRHLIALERMMNTKANNQTAKWSHFSDLPGGAGQISAQAGELMTMIGTTLDDKQADAFYNSLLEHEKQQIASNPNLKSEGSRVVGNSWIKAAMNNRKAIRNRLSKEYPGATIEAGSWDTAGEVEAMGLKDYKKNKGFSTDAYFKIKTKDGQEILDEVSLKKSTAVNFLNSGTGKLFEWDANIPDDINPNVYSKNQRKSLSDFGTANVKKLQNAVAGDAEFQALIKSKKIDLPSALAKLQAGKGSRDINKVVLSAITTLAKKGDKGALKYLQGVQDTHKAHQKAIISALGTNPKLKQGMLTAIREEFPLKAVGEGEESMAIGPNSLDRAVLKNIFETSDFDEIKQGLFAVTNEEPPYLAYKAGKKGRVIPIATIVAREDGVGYGGQIKFEMQLDKRFAKILEQANKNVYGG
jgi:hypothetical protein